MQHLILGQEGEDKAVDYLKSKGYKIIERNFIRRPFGEIDIVARKGDIIVFVEVKTIEEQDDFLPEDEITPRKYHALRKMVEIYLSAKKLPQETSCQIDIIAIAIKENKKYSLRHYKNAIEDSF